MADARDLVAELRRPGLLDERNQLQEVCRAGFPAIAAAASTILDDPVVSAGRAPSFVLHAPLELLARCALADIVEPDEGATARLVSLASRYAACTPRPGLDGDSTRALADAIASGDADSAERAVAGIDPAHLISELSRTALDRTGAAGHTNIYVHITAERPTQGLASMARGLARDLAFEPDAAIGTTPISELAGNALPDAFAGVAHSGRPTGRGIAALIDHVGRADPAGLRHLTAAIARGDDDHIAASLQRYAAAQMLIGDDSNVPYGWTHALTLTQGAITAGRISGDISTGLAVAATYCAAFWSAYGTAASPIAEADSHLAPVSAGDFEPLVAAALTSHDAHLVKYTLACTQCARADPAAGALYLRAARRLHAWWTAHPAADDPFAVG